PPPALRKRRHRVLASQPFVAYSTSSYRLRWVLSSLWGCVMEHRGVRYEIKISPGRNEWTWVAYTSPRPKQGSVQGSREAAVLAAEKVINRWWKHRHGLDAARAIRASAGARG